MTEYEASQKQRYIERQIRRWKREKLAMEAAGQDTAESAAKIRQWQDAQKDFLKQTGFKRQSDREQVAGFGPKQAERAMAEVEKYSKICYHRDGTIVVTDDWTQRERPRIPPRYAPNAVVDTISQNGRQRDRTFFDENGRQIRQVSNGPHGNKKRHPYGKNGEHAHDIIWKDGEIIGRPTRELTDAERKESADILESK